jgi:hypothetical protein
LVEVKRRFLLIDEGLKADDLKLSLAVLNRDFSMGGIINFYRFVEPGDILFACFDAILLFFFRVFYRIETEKIRFY